MTRIGMALLLSLASIGACKPAAERETGLVDLVVPMRDGVRLSADVYLPEGSGPWPVLVTRSPYPRIGGKAAFRAHPDRAGVFVREGFAVVVQDTRGRGDSEGDFGYHFTEGPDGFDTIEWVARQPWSNGRVGMFGNSYMGLTQVMAIRERPPALECAMPAGVPGRHVVDQNPYVGGPGRSNGRSAGSHRRRRARTTAALWWTSTPISEPRSTGIRSIDTGPC